MISAVVDGLTTTFAYDGDGRRLLMSVDGQVTTYTHDYRSGNRVLFEQGIGETKHYLYGLQCLGEQVADTETTETEWRYYQYDGNSLVRQTTNEEAEVTLAWTYSPEGAVLIGEEGPVTHLGCEGDATYDWSTGLIFKNGRYFDPTTGIWISLSPAIIWQVWNPNKQGFKNKKQKNRKSSRRLLLILLLLLFMLLLAGCGNGGTATPTGVPIVVCPEATTPPVNGTPGAPGTSVATNTPLPQPPTVTPQPPANTDTPQPPSPPTPVPTPAPMDLSEAGVRFLVQFELIIPYLYDDLGVGQGNCTIGIGHLVHLGPCEYSATNSYEAPFINGITVEQATQLFNEDLVPRKQAVRTSVTVPLEQYQFDALVSFAFSAGHNNLHSWPFVMQINSGQFDLAATTWLDTAVLTDIDNDGDLEESDGLIRRRAFEAELFREGNYRYDW